MRKISKKIIATALSLAMIAGCAFSTIGAVKNGTDVSAGKAWSSYSIHTREDKGEWEDALKKDGQFYNTNVTEESGLDSHKAYGENAKITTKTASSFTMNVTSTGWSGNWNPFTGEIMQSNPWGVTATKVVNVDRGRYYTISFKIKSTLQNELMEEKKRKDGTYYNVGTGKYNYVKHFHFKAYDNLDEGGAALKLSSVKATQGGTSVLETKKSLLKDFDPLIKMDSQNTADDGFVTVSAKVFVTASKANYQKKKSQATMGFKFAFGAFLKEYKDENNMSGTIEVKDFSIVAGLQTPVQPASLKAKKVSKKAVKIVYGKSTAATNYQIQYSTKSSMKSATTKTTKKTTYTIKKLKKGTKYFVRVRGTMKNGGKTYSSPWSKKLKVTTKK